jgi:hypothetical protein
VTPTTAQRDAGRTKAPRHATSYPDLPVRVIATGLSLGSGIVEL